MSNIAATKGIKFGVIVTDGGFILFPLTYVLGDVMAEVYGLKAARNAILVGFAMALLASVTFYLVQISPPTTDYTNQAAFEAVLGTVPRILLASVSGYLIGQFLNAYVVVRIKAVTKEKHMWARLIGSTLVGEFADTLIFCSIAAGAIGITTTPDFVNYVVVGLRVQMSAGGGADADHLPGHQVGQEAGTDLPPGLARSTTPSPQRPLAGPA